TVIGARDEPRAATAEVAARLARRARMATWRALLLRQCHLLQRKRFSPHLSRQQGPRRSHQPCIAGAEPRTTAGVAVARRRRPPPRPAGADLFRVVRRVAGGPRRD